MAAKERGKGRRKGAPQRSRMSALGERWESLVRLFKYSRKPDSEEYSAFLRIVGLALLVVGGIAFVIHLIATLLSGVFR